MKPKKEKKDLITKVMKYEIVKPIDGEWEVFGKVLNEIQYQSWKFANKAMQMFWDFNNFNQSYKERFGEYLNLKDNPLPNGYKNVESDIVNQLSDLISKLNSKSKDALIYMVSNKWNSDFKKIVSGERSIANFKRDLPIELHNKQFLNTKKQIMIYKENGHYIAEIKLISIKYAKEIGRKNCSFKVLLKSGDGTQRAILDKIISGEYKLGMSKIIKQTKNKTKWILCLNYSFEKKKESTLNKDRIMGIDLGINTPAYLAINDNKFFRQAVGDKDEIQNFRKQIESRRKKLLRQTKWSGEGRNGHGRKAKLKSVDVLSDKIGNFRNTKNHNWSRYIIELAVKNECGVIQMEDLTGIADGEKKSTFLGNWTYDDLQRKIKYKAEELGIEFKLIKPNYTSARCNKCGHIHRSANKAIWRPTQDQFKCMNCDYGHKFYVNADYNAAKNIATRGIEEIIENQLDKINKQTKSKKTTNEKFEEVMCL